MFSNIKDEYKEATEHASINTHNVNIIRNRGYKLGIFNLFLLTTIGVMGYVGFDSLNTGKIISSNSGTDKELLKILGNIDINSMAVEDKSKSISVSSAIDTVVNSSHLKDNSLYTQALSREINREEERIIVVRKGDTLVTLSEKYYGNPMAYSKIIKANKSLSQTSSTIFVGQELILPY